MYFIGGSVITIIFVLDIFTFFINKCIDSLEQNLFSCGGWIWVIKKAKRALLNFKDTGKGFSWKKYTVLGLYCLFHYPQEETANISDIDGAENYC